MYHKSFKVSVFFLFISFFCFSQDTIKPKTIKIILKVDTEGKMDRNNLPSFCTLEAVDLSGNTIVKPTNDLVNFLVEADIGDEIVWEGKTLNNKLDVDIKRIKRENRSRIFRRKNLYGKRRGKSTNRVVNRKILQDTKDRPAYKYLLVFKVNGRRYRIDPKIKVGNRHAKPNPG